MAIDLKRTTWATTRRHRLREAGTPAGGGDPGIEDWEPYDDEDTPSEGGDARMDEDPSGSRSSRARRRMRNKRNKKERFAETDGQGRGEGPRAGPRVNESFKGRSGVVTNDEKEKHRLRMLNLEKRFGGEADKKQCTATWGADLIWTVWISPRERRENLTMNGNAST